MGEASLIVDTGSSVSLIRHDVWKKAFKGNISPWNGCRLIGANGTALEIVGKVEEAEIVHGEMTFATDFKVIVEGLTSEGILGLDFLERHQCFVDVSKGILTLSDGALHIPLQKKEDEGAQISQIVQVCLVDTVIVPPRSQVIVGASTSSEGQGTWLLDGQYIKNCVVQVARTVVQSQECKLHVCLLNPRDQPVTIHKGTKIGIMERLGNNDVLACNVQESRVAKVPAEKKTILQNLVAKVGTHLSEAELTEFYNLLLDYSDIFAINDSDIDRTNGLKHNIKTGESKPIRQPARRLPPHQRDKVNKLLQEMQERDIIQPSSSPWASPIVLAQKKDGSVRFCVDYRKWNAVTTKDAYPLPQIDDTLDTLSGSKWFSTLDLLSGYWQVEMSQRDSHKTAFGTLQGLFEFKVMPFGLCNAPSTFQQLMDLVLAGLQWSRCLVYLDDVIILGRTCWEHLDNIKAVFQCIRSGGLKLRADKCSFLQKNVKYLGHVVGVDGLQV